MTLGPGRGAAAGSPGGRLCLLLVVGATGVTADAGDDVECARVRS